MNLLSLLFKSPIEAIVFIIGIVVAITVHECAHAWTAYKLGDDTPFLMGRVTLNPLAHLDPVGSIAFLLLGFGWGKPVVYNPLRLSRKSDELLIALAGPLSNIICAIALNLLAFGMAHLASPFINVEFLQLAAGINVILAAFNMIPIPPLDGSSIVAYFWPEYRSLVGGQIGLVILLALIFLPVGGGHLLNTIMTPILHAFSQLVTLFGVLGSGLF
jgi:Zn-dependent protease